MAAWQAALAAASSCVDAKVLEEEEEAAAMAAWQAALASVRERSAGVRAMIAQQRELALALAPARPVAAA